MIFRGQKHKLPKFPPEVTTTFYAYCEAVDPEVVPQLLEELEQCLLELKEMSQSNQKVDMEMVRALAEVSRDLLNRYDTFDSDHRSLIIGAIRYFVILDDPLPDTGFASGFTDDVMVMNHVLEQIGENDLIIPI